MMTRVVSYEKQGIRSKTTTAFKMLGDIALQKEGFRHCTPTEARTLHRLVAAGLVEVNDGGHYSISLLGRAHYVARLLDLGFRQLCYLTCIRNEMKKPLFAEFDGCDCREVDSYFTTLFPTIDAARARSNVVSKGFLRQAILHLTVKGPRFAELEAHAETLDALCLWLEEEYDHKAKETLRDPEFAKLF